MLCGKLLGGILARIRDDRASAIPKNGVVFSCVIESQCSTNDHLIRCTTLGLNITIRDRSPTSGRSRIPSFPVIRREKMARVSYSTDGLYIHELHASAIQGAPLTNSHFKWFTTARNILWYTRGRFFNSWEIGAK